MAHSQDCRFSPLFPHCNCGEVERAERLERREAEREAIQQLIANAEVITIESTGAPYKPRMVMASDLEDVLAGRIR